MIELFTKIPAILIKFIFDFCRSGLKTAFMLLPMLGVTWIFGLLANQPIFGIYFTYLFVGLNSFEVGHRNITLPFLQWRSHGGQGGKIAKNSEKWGKIAEKRKERGKTGKKRTNREEKAKIGKVLSLCPSWQKGLATLLPVVGGHIISMVDLLQQIVEHNLLS